MTFPKLPIYVITVRSFRDRHTHVEALAAKFGFQFEYVLDFDADMLTADDWARVERSMNPKSVSNTLKHLEAQRRLVDSGATVGLILEDDVLMFDGFAQKLHEVLELSRSLEDGWLIFLGGADNKIDKRFTQIRQFGLIPHPISTAEAYLVDRVGCQKRIVWLEHNQIDRQADHQLKLIDEMLGVNHFWVSHPMATQGSITGQFQTALDQSRAKHGSTYLSARYRWNRWRRQTLPRFFARLMNSTEEHS